MYVYALLASFFLPSHLSLKHVHVRAKLLRMLYSLIVNFISLLFTLCYFFLSISESVPIHVIVHVYVSHYLVFLTTPLDSHERRHNRRALV